MQPMIQSSIRAVIFDVGGVLLRTEDRKPRTLLADGLRLTVSQLEDLVFKGESGHAAQRGEISTDVHWAQVGKKLGVGGNEIAAIRESFFAGDVVDRQLVRFIGDLRPAFRTAIITNAFDDMRAALQGTYGIAPHFDHIVVSAEEGVMKPDPRIYRKTLSLCEVEAHQAIFVDDFPENVQGARRLGMQAIHFRDRDETLQTLNKALGLD